ncbi:MAG TPA: hypothetical protein VMX17_13110 [Candidatus Glassbacteria bacterium]|nr:hypothetical protein [Candidatus Glassbacteria bacterium]
MDENLTNKLLNDIKTMLHVNNTFLAAVFLNDYVQTKSQDSASEAFKETFKEMNDLIEVSSEALKRNSD